MLKIYQKIGKLEGISELLDKEELKNTDELIDRRNLMCCYTDENQLPDFAYFFGYASDNELILEERQKIKVLVKKRVGKYSIIYTASKLCVAMSFTV